jgi:hypothetical protein
MGKTKSRKLNIPSLLRRRPISQDVQDVGRHAGGSINRFKAVQAYWPRAAVRSTSARKPQRSSKRRRRAHLPMLSANEINCSEATTDNFAGMFPCAPASSAFSPTYLDLKTVSTGIFGIVWRSLPR